MKKLVRYAFIFLMTLSFQVLNAQCIECLDEPFEPVCITTVDGEVIPFPNACFAECEGYTDNDFAPCDNGSGGEPCACGFDFAPVCVDTDDGIITFPNTCFAECEGFSADDFVACDTGGGGEPCDCGFDFDPVCVDTDDGIITFPNTCFAECEGFSTDDFVACDTGGGGEPCDCPFDFNPVCVAVDGETIPFPNACFAECEGFTADDFVACDLGGNGIDCIECADEPIEPVCVDSDGEVCVFPNECFALCAGYEVEDFLAECDSTVIEPNDCLCDFVFDPVCVETADGEIIPFPNACFAECEGYEADDFVACDLGGNGIDCIECADEPIEPVCVDSNGEVCVFPNECFALCAGYEVEDFLAECDSTVIEPNDCLCDFVFDPVCVETADGEIIPFPNACFAECEGFTADDFEDCDDGSWGEPCDCDFTGEPVCVDVDGVTISFPNTCFAECEGFTADDFVDCTFIGGGNPCDCDLSVLEPICVIDENGEEIELPNACIADCLADILGIELEPCDEGDNFTQLGNHEAIQLEQKKTIGLKIYPNPVKDFMAVTIQSTDETTQQADLTILSLNGQVVKTERTTIANGSNQVRLDVSNLNDGIYFLQVQTAQGVESSRFVK